MDFRIFCRSLVDVAYASERAPSFASPRRRQGAIKRTNARARERKRERERVETAERGAAVFRASRLREILNRRIEFAVINSDNYSTRGEREYQSTSTINQTGSRG